MPIELNPIQDPTKVGAFNTNFQNIEDYINSNLLKRNGLLPGEANQLETALDLNSNNIANVNNIGVQSLTVQGVPISTFIDTAQTASTTAVTAASQAQNSQVSAAASATSASTSANTASTASTSASADAASAATSETNAASSAASAATSESNAASSSVSAASSATAAEQDATTAQLAALDAETSETNALNSATSAATSASNAAASFDSFDDRYLGPKSSDPALDNDGDPLLVGALYFNSTINKMKEYTGSAWQESYALVELQGSATGDIDMAGNALAITQYDIASISTTATIDLASGNEFTIDASTARTLTFANVPAAGRAMTVVLTISGAAAITWPAGIRWHGDGTTAPELGATWTIVVLSFDGLGNISGVLGASA